MVTFPGIQSFCQLVEFQHLEETASKRDNKEADRRRLLLENRVASHCEGAAADLPASEPGIF